jgi:hypothetical protein
LAKQGIILTKAEKDQIDELVKAGKMGRAQAMVLSILERRTKGAAAAMNGPYKDAMETLGDVTEDAQKALAIGFMPVLQRVADKLSTAMADPATMKRIEGFGRILADAFDSALKMAEKLPWDKIGASLELAATGAKTILGVFTAMPDWVQTAVLTGWGLNKLTGGALGKIGLELIGGLRGSTPMTPMYTKEVGLPGALGGGKGVLPLGGAGAAAGAGAGGILIAAASVTAIGVAIGLTMFHLIPRLVNGDRPAAPGAGPGGQPAFTSPQAGTIGAMQASQFVGLMPKWAELAAAAGAKAIVPGGGRGDASTAAEVKRLGDIQGVVARAEASGRKVDAAHVAATMEKNARATADASIRVGDRIATMTSAVRGIKLDPKIIVPVYVTSTVSVRNNVIATQVRARYGATTQRRIAEEG